ncbi:MAG: hemerythrin domain-containing protein [Candidatus Pacearchaeota archaeon]|jgi:hemerythrin-like domain-containing protein|nr:hypothetical protein [Candidatus Pacearchaeota archaeon]MDP7520991.1 hemerythrin domain-containing protein [Candidatus Pacearchaeota archaeon]|tara:strand:+ start:3833 stop:4363 length:531 start_codon:yes stop_codon:yes gene_type:complete
MGKITKILSDEHKNILRLTKLIEKECESGENINKDFFIKAIYFIRNYADKFHHAKEEDILFKELLKDSVQGKLPCNPIEQMLHEHEEGRNFIKETEIGIRENNTKKIIENITGYVNLIREHIYKEDNILYPMADGVLDKKTEQSILNRFSKAEKMKDKKKCLLMLKEFKEIIKKRG